MSRQPVFFVLASFVVAVCARTPRLPEAGESLIADGLVIEPGGKGFNVAAGLRRLGCRVDGIAPAGDDPISAVARAALRSARLPMRMLHRLAGPTGAGVGLIDPSGDNRIVVHPGANARLGAAHIDALGERLQAAAWVIASLETADAAVARAFVLGRRAGASTMLNVSPFRPTAWALLDHCDVVVVNVHEAGLLAGSAGVGVADLPERLHKLGVVVVVITRGAAGASLYRRHDPVLHQAAFVTEAVDTTGAGDAFLAALCAWRGHGADWAACLRAACASGAIVAAREGVLGALPERREVEDRLAGT